MADQTKNTVDKTQKTASRFRDLYLFLAMGGLVVIILASVLSMGKVWQDGHEALKGPYDAAEVVDLGNGSYRMYYDIVAKPQTGVYSAISNDAVHWKPEPGIRKESADWPSVIKQADGVWRMYYHSGNSIKSATSPDGITWTDDEGIRIDTADSKTVLTIDDVSEPAVRQLNDGAYLMVYTGIINQKFANSALNNNKTSLFLWAISQDGTTFDKKGLAIDSRNDMFQGQINGPQLVRWTDGTMHLFFWSKKGIYDSPFKNDAFIDPRIAFAKSENGRPSATPPADPALLKVGNKWFMYYQEHDKGIYYATLGN